MTAGRSWAGSARRTARRSSRRSRRRSRRSPARRRRSTPPGGPTPASMRWRWPPMSTSHGRSRRFRLADGTQRQAAAAAGRDPRRRETVADDWHARFSCIGRRYLYRIVNRRAPLALEAGRAWRVPVVAPRRRDARGRAGAWSAGTISPPSARPIASRKARSRRSTGSTVRRDGRDDRDRGGGALLPPPPGALDGRLPAAGRARQMDARRI